MKADKLSKGLSCYKVNQYWVFKKDEHGMLLKLV